MQHVMPNNVFLPLKVGFHLTDVSCGPRYCFEGIQLYTQRTWRHEFHLLAGFKFNL